jgi:hypothetical protein
LPVGPGESNCLNYSFLRGKKDIPLLTQKSLIGFPGGAKVMWKGTRAKAEGRRERAEGSRQKAEGKGQRAEGKRQRGKGSRLPIAIGRAAGSGEKGKRLSVTIGRAEGRGKNATQHEVLSPLADRN